MSRYYSYVNTAAKIIIEYEGAEPLARFLKRFLSKSKKYGSKDRKIISMLCYQYFRAAKILKITDTEEQIIIAHFLCSDHNSSILADLKPDWHKIINKNIDDKLVLLREKITNTTLFPFENLLSNSIDLELLCKSMLIQPRLFVRIRPGFEHIVLQKLKIAQIPFEKLNDDSLSFENSTKIEDFIEIGKEVIIQDLNSQNVGKLIEKYIPNIKKPGLKIWDCCAASGGKSIMLFDKNIEINLTVSDIRQSILQNLQERFEIAGINNYQSFVADLSDNNNNSRPINNFDLIIADVPCTGSGTWSRTPEQMFYFNEDKISYFTDLQKNILITSTKYLAIGGYFVFITCSVFMRENEENVQYLQNVLKLKLIATELLKGYIDKADSMFIAIFEKE